jgi:hypothetical protein
MQRVPSDTGISTVPYLKAGSLVAAAFSVFSSSQAMSANPKVKTAAKDSNV